MFALLVCVCVHACVCVCVRARVCVYIDLSRLCLWFPTPDYPLRMPDTFVFSFFLYFAEWLTDVGGVLQVFCVQCTHQMGHLVVC